jgi:hypothetical protein
MANEFEIEAKELVTKTEMIERDFSGFAVQDNSAYMTAGEHLKRIKTLSSEIEAKRTSMTRPLNETLKKINEFFKGLAARPLAAEATLKGAMLKFQREQEAVRVAEEARLREAAKKEEERQLKIKEEQERAWREKEEEARERAKKLAAAGKAAEAEAARIEAEKAAKKADERAAQAENIFVPVPTVESQVSKVKGLAIKTEWKFEIVDAKQIPADFLMPDEKAIGAFVRATKGAKSIAGVRIFSVENMSAGKA